MCIEFSAMNLTLFNINECVSGPAGYFVLHLNTTCISYKHRQIKCVYIIWYIRYLFVSKCDLSGGSPQKSVQVSKSVVYYDFCVIAHFFVHLNFSPM